MRASAGNRILMLLENNAYQEDVRVRNESQALRGAGYQVTVISPHPENRFRHSTLNGVALYQYPASPDRDGFLGYAIEFAWAMLATFLLSVVVLFREGFDIIHAHNPPDTFVLVGAIYKLAGKRYIFDHHDLSPEMYNAKFGGKGVRIVYICLLAFERLTFRMADHVISTNESYREIAMSRGRVPSEQVTVVRNAPDLDRVRLVEPHQELRQRASTIIGYVGEMSRHDGVDYLLRAVSHLVHDFGRTDVLCVLIGRGSALPMLKSEASQLKIKHNVWFTGRISDEDLMRYLSTADICVDPDPSNPFNDRSSMIKLTEYMALGKPIVAFDLPEHRFTAQEAAVYAEPNDELDFARRLVELIDDPTRRERMGSSGRQRIETELGWHHQEERLLGAYSQLVGRS
jgi:glycosyltransferase involved in cell wall biosynthesis